MPDAYPAATIPPMLIPRFSLRWLFGLTTVCAVFSLVIAQAYRGQSWAIGVVSFIGAGLVLWSVHIAMFLVVWAANTVFVRYDKTRELVHSPFATDQPPPQIIEPTDPGVT